MPRELGPDCAGSSPAGRPGSQGSCLRPSPGLSWWQRTGIRWAGFVRKARRREDFGNPDRRRIPGSRVCGTGVRAVASQMVGLPAEQRGLQQGDLWGREAPAGLRRAPPPCVLGLRLRVPSAPTALSRQTEGQWAP